MPLIRQILYGAGLLAVLIISGCTSSTRDTADFNHLILRPDGAVVKSSRFNFANYKIDFYCGKDDVYFAGKINWVRGEKAYKVVALRQDNEKIFSESEFENEVLGFVKGHKLNISISDGESVKFSCGTDDAYIKGGARKKDRQLYVDYADKTSEMTSWIRSYEPGLIATYSDLKKYIGTFTETPFARKVTEDFFKRNFVFNVRNKDSSFKSSGQGGGFSSAKMACKDIAREVEVKLLNINAIDKDIAIGVEFFLETRFTPKQSKEGTTMSYKNNILKKKILLSKANKYTNSEQFSFPCVPFSARYVYANVTDFSLVEYKVTGVVTGDE